MFQSLPTESIATYVDRTTGMWLSKIINEKSMQKIININIIK